MSNEYGIFNDEGCIERQFWTEEEAGRALADLYAAGERELSIHELCDEHDEQPRDTCEDCFTEDCTHDSVRQVSEDDVECLNCGVISA